jgi:tetratricopeptide (TPR) repeat protein
MKRVLYLTLLSLMVLTACGTSNYANPDMPEELKTFHEEQLSEHLDILKDDSENVNSIFEVAYRYDQLGDYDAAIKYYEKVLDIDAVHRPAINNLANIYETMEDYEMAIEYIKELYVLEPLSIEVTKDTVRLLLLADDPENAYLVVTNFRELTLENEDSQEVADSLKEDINTYMNVLNGIE